ncbi:MAG: FAD-dependent monooxygenase [Bosea sp. (in: a-proteobacteria)]
MSLQAPSEKISAQNRIAIVGAGAVGLAAALKLAGQGWQVTVLGQPQAPRDGRTVALLDGSWQMLQELGLGEALEHLVAPLRTMRLVDDTGSLFRQPPVEFQSREIGLEAFGWNIENAALVDVLAAAVTVRREILLVSGQVSEITWRDDGAVLCGEGFAPVKAALVIGADGRNSAVRGAAGITTTNWRYPQAALTTILRHKRDHREVSTEFHTRSGPCTLVPLPGQRSSLVWMMAKDAAPALMALNDKALAERIERQVHSLLGKMMIDGPRGLVPMGGLSVERFTTDRAALIGEAAHAFPPIGAQGLNLGFRDVRSLCETLGEATERRDETINDKLAAYERDRASDVRLRTMAVDALNRTLLSDMLPADFMRGAGLLTLANVGPLRRMVMRQGLGA